MIKKTSQEAQLSQCFAREFSHAKVTLQPESRRDRYRAYELNKANIAFILVKPQNLSFSNWMLQADDKLIPRKSHSTVSIKIFKIGSSSAASHLKRRLLYTGHGISVSQFVPSPPPAAENQAQIKHMFFTNPIISCIIMFINSYFDTYMYFYVMRRYISYSRYTQK